MSLLSREEDIRATALFQALSLWHPRAAGAVHSPVGIVRIRNVLATTLVISAYIDASGADTTVEEVPREHTRLSAQEVRRSLSMRAAVEFLSWKGRDPVKDKPAEDEALPGVADVFLHFIMTGDEPIYPD